MLGMGGGQLYTPILFWLGLDLKTEAIPLSLLLNLLSSSSAAFTYAKKKMIAWKVALPFGLTMVAFAPLGTLLNLELPEKPVILILALFTATAAILMLSGRKPEHEIKDKKKYLIGFAGGAILGTFTG
ncbi:MAG: sulfite exporter TauE/SafE family protein, partial [Promethearchaeota archaeon]